MIPAEIVFITMPAPTDFTGPIIGIAGVLIGSAIGFLGLWWQHHAQRAYDIRKITANLIAAGEELRDDYLGRNNSASTSEMNRILGAADAKLNEMYRHQRHLELVSKPNIANAAETYLEASGVYHTYTRSLYGASPKPSDEALSNSYVRWNEAKVALIALLNKDRAEEGK